MRLWLRSRLASAGSSWASRAVSAQLGNRLLAKSRSCSLEAKRRSLPGDPCDNTLHVHYICIRGMHGFGGRPATQGMWMARAALQSCIMV